MTTVEFVSHVLGNEDETLDLTPWESLWFVAVGTVTAGTAVILDQDSAAMGVETASYVGTPPSNYFPAGIALNSAANGELVLVAHAGVLGPSITALPPSSPPSYAAVDVDGTLSAIPTPTASDWIVGTVDDQGRLTLDMTGSAAKEAVTIHTMKNPVRAAQTVELDAHSFAGGVITMSALGDLNGMAAFDGVTDLVAGDHVLIWMETDGLGDDNEENGAYAITTLGDISTAAVLTRVADMDESPEVYGGIYVPVLEGTLYANRLFSLTTTGDITLNTTGLSFRTDTPSNFGYLVADLRLLAGTPGQFAFLSGYTAVGDGADGWFYWSSDLAADDAGTILNAGGLGASSAGWRRDISGPLDPRWFGAKLDGVTDDTAALALARDAAIALSTVLFVQGSGTPEGAITAPVGSIFHRTDGGSNTTFYIKSSGAGTNSGWAPAIVANSSPTVDGLIVTNTVRLGGALMSTGTGSPEGVVVGSVGDLYRRTDGGSNTTLYMKESGASTDTGWVAMISSGSSASVDSLSVTTTASIGGATISTGTGSPESVVVGSVGDLYRRTDGASNSTLYMKESGVATDTGWVAMIASGSAASVDSLAATSTVSVGGVSMSAGAGTPEGSVIGTVGDVFVRTDGGINGLVYVKISGVATDTGWKQLIAVGDQAVVSSVNCIAGTGTFATVIVGGAIVWGGSGTPEGVVNGDPGDIFIRQDGGAGTTLYVKETGSGTTTGWVAYNASVPGLSVNGSGNLVYTNPSTGVVTTLTP
jgi:hypothetical protein